MNITLILTTLFATLAFLIGLFALKLLRAHRWPTFAPPLLARRFAAWLQLTLRAAFAYSARARLALSTSAFCFLLSAFQASAQVTPVKYVNALSNVTSIAGAVTAITASNAVAAGIPIVLNRGVSIMGAIGTTNASGTTTNVWVFWQCTQDGTNWSSLPAFATVHNIQGTTNWISYTNITSDILNNVAAIRPLQFSNAHQATVWFTNLMVGTATSP